MADCLAEQSNDAYWDFSDYVHAKQSEISGPNRDVNASIARLQAQWSTVVGPELARMTRPEALVAGRGRAGKLLRLRVPGAAALEIQQVKAAPRFHNLLNPLGWRQRTSASAPIISSERASTSGWK